MKVEGLSKRFGEFLAVDSVSFRLAERGSLGIVGESGSGKTTTARMIVGLEAPSAGTIFCCGQDRSRRPRSRDERRSRGRDVQIVFQNPYSSLDPRQSARSSIGEVLRIHHERFSSAQSRERRVGELVDLVGLSERESAALPAALSGGQRQRVAIARALAAEPRILILDEAVAALDVSIQAQILNLLDDVRAETGVSYLLISHDLAVVRQLTDEVIVMQSGRVVEGGATAAVLDHPREEYTKVLRASVPEPGWVAGR